MAETELAKSGINAVVCIWFMYIYVYRRTTTTVLLVRVSLTAASLAFLCSTQECQLTWPSM